MLHVITWDVSPEIISLGSFAIRYYSLFYALAFVLGYMILARIFKKEGVPIKLLDKLAVYMLVGTIAGARLGHCLFYEPDYYLSRPLEMLLPFTWGGAEGFRFTGYQGLASHGGVIGIILALYLYHRKTKKPLLWVFDRIVIVGALAAAFIRFGNLMNSEIYGYVTDLPWGFIYVRAGETLPKHPTQIYEGVSYLIIFVTLLLIYNKHGLKLKPGFLTGLLLITVFGVRFLIEFVKEPQVGFEENMLLNMGQLLSIPFIIAGILFIYFSRKLKPFEKI